MAKAIRRSGVRRVPLSEIEDDFPRFLREAESEGSSLPATANQPVC